MNELPVTSEFGRSVRRAPVLLCLGLILIYPLFSVPVQGSIHNLVPRVGEIGARVVTEAAIWTYGAIVLTIALFWEKRTLASIGLRRFSFASLWFAILGAIAMVAAGALGAQLVYGVLHQAQHAEAQAASLLNGSVVYALCIAVRAGVIEEILFRGLAIEQLMTLTRARWLSAFLATAVFIVIHALRFDWIQLIPIAAVSIVLTGLYLWKHDLWANILAHIMVDGVGLVTLALPTHKLAHQPR